VFSWAGVGGDHSRIEAQCEGTRDDDTMLWRMPADCPCLERGCRGLLLRCAWI
jgi:hypothetical protein